MKVSPPFTTASAPAVILAMLVFNISSCEQAAGDMTSIAHGAKHTKGHEQIAQDHKKQKVLHNFSPAHAPLVSAMTTNDNQPRKLDSSSCDDSPLKVLTGQGRKSAKTCAFIADMPKKFCKGKVIKSHCPSACGVCDAFGAVDSKATFIFEDKKRECAWLHGFLEPSALWQISDLCEDEGIRETCRYTCGFFFNSCEIEPTSSPTPVPTTIPCAKKIIESKFGQVIDGSPKGKALDWLIGDIGDDDCDNVDKIIQRFVLAAFYYSTGGWYDDNNWLGGESECGWYGLTCNDDQVLTEIDINEYGLNGTILEEISALESLESLVLYHNYLSGTIPDSIGDLKKLNHLDLYDNYLSGSGILDIIGDMTELNYLSLSDNYLSGTIPDLSRLVGLMDFSIGSNRLTGQITSQFVGLTDLTYFSIGYNSFTGSIPDMTEFTNLRLLFLAHSNFTGQIDPKLFELPKLEWLWLHENNLTGPIPDNFGGSTSLTDLKLHDNLLTGSIPDITGDTLQNMGRLSLFSNKLSDPVPDSLCALRSRRLWYLGADCAPPGNAQNECPSDCCHECYVGKGI